MLVYFDKNNNFIVHDDIKYILDYLMCHNIINVLIGYDYETIDDFYKKHTHHINIRGLSLVSLTAIDYGIIYEIGTIKYLNENIEIINCINYFKTNKKYVKLIRKLKLERILE